MFLQSQLDQLDVTLWSEVSVNHTKPIEESVIKEVKEGNFHVYTARPHHVELQSPAEAVDEIL